MPRFRHRPLARAARPHGRGLTSERRGPPVHRPGSACGGEPRRLRYRRGLPGRAPRRPCAGCRIPSSLALGSPQIVSHLAGFEGGCGLQFAAARPRSCRVLSHEEGGQRATVSTPPGGQGRGRRRPPLTGAGVDRSCAAGPCAGWRTGRRPGSVPAAPLGGQGEFENRADVGVERIRARLYDT